MIELLVALAIASVAMALAGSIFLAGHAQFLSRLNESERLAERIRLKHAIQRVLAGQIETCGSGNILTSRAENPAGRDPEKQIRAQFQEVIRIEFNCFEVSASGAKPVPWAGRFQPDWIEYRAILRGRDGEEEFRGSLLR